MWFYELVEVYSALTTTGIRQYAWIELSDFWNYMEQTNQNRAS